MSQLTTALPFDARTRPEAYVSKRPVVSVVDRSQAVPSRFVRSVFYLSLFAVPFHHLYLPGTGERIGVTRIVQGLIFAAILAQPRVCIRRLPTALLWFASYFALRTIWGVFTTPDLADLWWPDTFAMLQFALPWVWFCFNILQYPNLGRRGLWALGLGCALCAFLHLLGVGVAQLDRGIEGRTTIFGENANVVGATYAIGIVAMIGLTMLRSTKTMGRLMLLPLIACTAVGLAKTGSRTAALIASMGLCVLILQSRSFVPRIKRYATLGLVTAILGGILLQVPVIYKRLESFQLSGERAEARAKMFPVLWEIFLRSPIYGTGPARYEAELTWRAMPEWVKQHRSLSAHNLPLLLLVETGVIGFLIFAWPLATCLRAGWRARMNSCGFMPLALLLPLAIAGVISSDPSSKPVFWLAIAYCLAGRA